MSDATARDLVLARRVLAAYMLLRIAVGPYSALAGQPEELFAPVWFLAPLGHMPTAGVFLVIQVAGAAAAARAVARPSSPLPFAGAWVALLVLAGLRGSLGKILHNDVLLLVAAVPMVVGWSARDARQALAGSRLLVGGLYFAAGYQKLRHTGLDWVFSDNFRWILYQAARSGRAVTDRVALFVADRAWLATASAAALLGAELVAPLLLAVRRLRLPFLAVTIAFHGGTWLTLGLDYWGWIVMVAAVTVPWSRIEERLGAWAPSGVIPGGVSAEGGRTGP
ncbi:MAG TPA: hypothetical protein VFV35_03630 [Acidimicrobiales bacterium]|nr:hypothetical protein [Acidimicrobiales bacterium]